MRQSQQGQAAVEYILIIILSLTLIFGVASKLIAPVRDFVQNIAGAYVECLLETGEVPFIVTKIKNSKCTIENLEKNGKLAGDSGGGTGGAGSGRSSGSGSNNDGNLSDKSQRDTASNNGSGGGSGSGSSGGGGGGSSSGPSLNSSGGLSEAANSSGAGDSGSSSGGGGSGRRTLANPDGTGSSGDSIPYALEQDYGRGISGVIQTKKTEKQKLEENLAKAKTPIKSNEEEDRLRQQSFTAPAPPKKVAGNSGNNDGGMGLNLGMYLRYFIIGGIIFALIIMVFTQLNNLRKSWGGD